MVGTTRPRARAVTITHRAPGEPRRKQAQKTQAAPRRPSTTPTCQAPNSVTLATAWQRLEATLPPPPRRHVESRLAEARPPTLDIEVHATHSPFTVGGFAACVVCGSIGSKRPKNLSRPCRGDIPPGSDVGIRNLMRGELPPSLKFWPDGLDIDFQRFANKNRLM